MAEAHRAHDEVALATVFETRLRWMAVCWRPLEQPQLVASCFDRDTIGDVLAHIPRAARRFEVQWCDQGDAPKPILRLCERLQSYADGESVAGKLLGDFSDVPLDLSSRTDFQRRVLLACQRITPGETISYGELALRAGSPRAARAVGSVMSGNRLPLIVPCHRVVGSSGKLHGYSSPSGMKMKQRLLQMERDSAIGAQRVNEACA